MDCRYHLKATFSVYGGKDFTCDMSCNWDGYDDELDSRIKDFFLDAYTRSKAKWDERRYELDRERNAERLRESELAELQRLKDKYGD